jgi:glycosyltransferase involved in cell wall biosynthesis
LDAFEILWRNGFDLNLVIIGKRCWLTESLSQRLEKHPELYQQLFWLEKSDDRILASAYSSADCLLAASFGEGFGRPLIEAASFGLPIIARDIPVFREVAGGHASYFQGQSGADIAEAIQTWLKTPSDDLTRASSQIRIKTWDMCGDKVTQLLTSPDGKLYPATGIERKSIDAIH